MRFILFRCVVIKRYINLNAQIKEIGVENIEGKEEKIALYYQSIYKFALLQLKSSDLAMDVTQEVFYRYIECNTKFTSGEHERNWLYLITSNICKSYWRSGWYKHIFLSETLVENPIDITPDKAYIEKEESKIILRAILKLPQKYREIIHLYYYEDMSIKEISFITGKRESTIQTQLSRGREKLRVLLEEGGYARF